MTKTPFYQNNAWWIEVAIGHYSGRPKKKCAELTEKKGDDRDKDRKIDNSSPDL